MSLIVLIGDSIRMGYQKFVWDELSNETELWAPEQNGGTSSNVLVHLDEWVIDRKPDIVHLNCGLHDIKREFGSEENNVPLNEYRENVERIIRIILQNTDAKVIWAKTTPVNEKWHHQRKGFDRFELDVKVYNQEATKIAQKLGIKINDLYQVVIDAGRDKILREDGVHFTEKGYAILGNAVVKAIRSCLDS